mmetsp:Transcript_29051/g.87878  ORF Transcript_29051/g.87878 Transcript_29051/m.87878 type:complete len:543 (+) Transcript_29051:312-1940(+)
MQPQDLQRRRHSLRQALEGIQAELETREVQIQDLVADVRGEDFWQTPFLHQPPLQQLYPRAACEDAAQFLVGLVVPRVLGKGLQVEVPAGEAVQNVSPVVWLRRLSMLQVHAQAGFEDLDGEEALARLLIPRHAKQGARIILVFLPIGKDVDGRGAVRPNECRVRPNNSDVHHQARLAHGHGQLEAAPDPRERHRREGDVGLVVEDRQEPVGDVHGLEKAGILRIRGQVLAQRVLRVGVRADPIRRVEGESAGGIVSDDAQHELLDQLPPPMRHKPLRGLWFCTEQLDECAIVLLGCWLDQPLVQVVQIQNVEGQSLPRRVRPLRGGHVKPMFAIPRRKLQDTDQLFWGQRPVLGQRDAALEAERATDFRHVELGLWVLPQGRLGQPLFAKVAQCCARLPDLHRRGLRRLEVKRVKCDGGPQAYDRERLSVLMALVAIGHELVCRILDVLLELLIRPARERHGGDDARGGKRVRHIGQVEIYSPSQALRPDAAQLSVLRELRQIAGAPILPALGLTIASKGHVHELGVLCLLLELLRRRAAG